MLMRRSLPWIALSCFAVVSVYSQTTGAADPSNSTFKAKTQVVVEDVVVTDHKGEPVSGLQQADFQIFEEGKPQTILSFEEHKGISDQAPPPPLPPHVYANFPADKPADSLNVLLLDAVNTPPSDQAKVRLQLDSFLKSIPAGSHIAIFALSSGLYMVQGFTSDPSLLLSALNKQSVPKSSPLLGVGPVENMDTQINKQLTLTGAGTPSATIASVEKLQAFQNITQSTQDHLRMTRTLQGLQSLANLLTGIPGRKNVIWFSDSFPLSIIPGRGVQSYETSSSDQADLRRTVNMLAAAQMAIYPISAMGLEQKFVSNDARVKSVAKSEARTVQGQQISEVTSPKWDTDEVLLQQDSREYARQDANLATMVEFARDTGGEAFNNTNGLKEALVQAINEGAHYYTISYSPTDQRIDGHYRAIEVKLLKGDYKLAYRHGYFAEIDGEKKKEAVQLALDPLRPFMMSGIPAASQIIYKIRVLPVPPPSSGPNPAASAKPSLKGPSTRYGVDFLVLLRDLVFTTTADGQHKARIEITLAAYDRDGTPVNSIEKSAEITLTPDLYAAFTRTGLPLHEEIDVPENGAYLRTGICDLTTDQAGTLEIPLNQLAASVVGPK